MEDPLAHLPQELLAKDPLAYVAQGAKALPRELQGAWLLGVVSGFLWPEAPAPKDLPALFRRLEGAWREAEEYFLETGLDFPVLVSQWAKEALDPLLHRKKEPTWEGLTLAFHGGRQLGQVLQSRA